MKEHDAVRTGERIGQILKIDRPASVAFDHASGAAYLVAKAIKKSRVVAFADLGMEAIYKFEVEDMPVSVAVDVNGESVHTTGPALWKKKIAG